MCTNIPSTRTISSPSDLNLDCYLPKNINRDHAATWIADWLDEFRKDTLSRADALQKLRHPKYPKGKFV